MSTTFTRPEDTASNTQLSANSTDRVHSIRHRISMLRSYLAENELDACLIPSSDPHQSEYPADHWKFREYISGFTGSSGTLVVTLNVAGLWTDSRYFLQAEAELADTGIELLKAGLPDTPSIEEWLFRHHCHHVALDGQLFSTREASRLSQSLAEKGIQLHTHLHPYIKVWPGRPPLPQAPASAFPLSVSGEPTDSKLNRVRQSLREAGADALPLAALDEIAWLLNIRGADIAFNPVLVAYVYLDTHRCILFAEGSKIEPDVQEQLDKDGVELAPYDTFLSFLGELRETRILFDPAGLNHNIRESIDPCCTLVEGDSPVNRMKAAKNTVEIEGFRLAMQKDGAAWVRLLKWVEEVTAKGRTGECEYPTEFEVGKKIASLRRRDEAYVCESFAPIAAFADHGAIVHYEADPENGYSLRGEGVLLMDLGAHYRHGTTDTTRTVYLNGDPSDSYKTDYTCLLKGLIALSNAIFPEGTRGSQLDVLARQFLWNRRLNYLHGTGHGIGHCLFVHEGPQSIRMNENPVSLEPGMVLSDEPGLYRTGEYGIRLENVIHVVENEPSVYGRFFSFETLTLVPFNLDSIEPGLLEPHEERWLNRYHQSVFEQVSPFLDADERDWLRNKTRPISEHIINT